jgi:hypothetical protein
VQRPIVVFAAQWERMQDGSPLGENKVALRNLVIDISDKKKAKLSTDNVDIFVDIFF